MGNAGTLPARRGMSERSDNPCSISDRVEAGWEPAFPQSVAGRVPAFPVVLQAGCLRSRQSRFYFRVSGLSSCEP